MESQEKKDLLEAEFHHFSQNYEDGILQYIFSKVGTTNRRFVEFGCGDGKWCNTANLSINHGWNGLVMDGDKKNIDHAVRYYEAELKSNPGRVRAIQCLVTVENIEQILFENGIAGEIDLLSIDIDGNDYWVWKAIQNVNPRVVVIEYNASIEPEWSVTVKYDPEFDRMKSIPFCPVYHGASLSALTKLAGNKGYCLVGCDSRGVNAFFVRKDVAKNKINSMTVQEAFYPHKRRLEVQTLAQQFEFSRTLDFEEV